MAVSEEGTGKKKAKIQAFYDPDFPVEGQNLQFHPYKAGYGFEF